MLTDIKKKTVVVFIVNLAFLSMISLLGTKFSQAQSADPLRTKLELEVQKIINNGHLKPGYFSAGMLDMMMDGRVAEGMQDYFHNPADTIYTLTIAYPFLSPSLQVQVKNYLQQEYNNYPLGSITHIGWSAGANRSSHPWPADLQLAPQAAGIAPKTSQWTFWNFNPFNFYAAWKYAQVMGNATDVFNNVKSRYEAPPADSAFTTTYPPLHVLNIYIAGHIGYLELEKLATGSETASIRSTLNRLLSLRLSLLDNMIPESVRGLEAGGFIYLVPELGDILYQQKRTRVQQYIDAYEKIMPYWFEAGADEQIKDPLRGDFGAEGSNTPLYAVNSLFSARAYALKQSRSELEKYLDVPFFETGDLFYIQNLVATLKAGGQLPSVSPGNPADTDGDGDADIDDFRVWINNYSQLLHSPTNGDFNLNGKVELLDFGIWKFHFSI